MADRVVRNVENDYLMCSICLGRYSDPRLLPCGHTFCHQCLSDHIRQTVTDRDAAGFSCPNDRTQVPRPSPTLSPKDWASAFPIDAFLGSLLSAVMLHANESASGVETDASVCQEHKGRLKEFFCVECCKAVCPYCVVRRHKRGKCDCISIEEAVDKCRPTFDVLRQKIQKQMQTARKISRGENPQNNSLKMSRMRAMTELTDLETKLMFFYQTAIRQLDEMKKTIRETGMSDMSEHQQFKVIVQNMNETLETIDDVYNHGSGIQILDAISKIEQQTKGYDDALKAYSANSNSIQINFAPNPEMERVFENAPALGSVVVTGVVPPSNTTPSTARPFLPAPRTTVASARAAIEIRRNSDRRASTDRAHHGSTGRSNRIAPPVRSKVTFSVNVPGQAGSCWQLTGIAVLGSGSRVVVTDAHNCRVRLCDYQASPMECQQVELDCPVCVSCMNNSSDVIVTLPETSKLVILQTETCFEVKEFIETAKPYEGVSKLPGNNFVTSCCVIGKQCVDIIEPSGRVLRSFDKDGSGNQLFSWPRFLCTSGAGNILVSDRDGMSLLCLDQAGVIQWTYATPASPWGVTWHEGGAIYLCLDSNVVQVVSSTGSLVQSKFITGKDGVKVPYAVHATGSHLAVTEWGSSLFAPNSPWVHVFDI